MKVVCNWTSRVVASVAVIVAMLAPEMASAEVVTLQELEEQALHNRALWEAVEDLDLDRLETMVNEISLADLPAAASAIMAGSVRGRTVVKIG